MTEEKKEANKETKTACNCPNCVSRRLSKDGIAIGTAIGGDPVEYNIIIKGPENHVAIMDSRTARDVGTVLIGLASILEAQIKEQVKAPPKDLH